MSNFGLFCSCPVDWEIMGELEYSSSKTTAIVHFQAHRFPYTSSVYYQCNVRLCIRHAGGCEDTVSLSKINADPGDYSSILFCFSSSPQSVMLMDKIC